MAKEAGWPGGLTPALSGIKLEGIQEFNIRTCLSGYVGRARLTVFYVRVTFVTFKRLEVWRVFMGCGSALLTQCRGASLDHRPLLPLVDVLFTHSHKDSSQAHSGRMCLLS